MMFIHNYCKFDIFMKKLNKYFNLIILLILGCAAVAPPSGGNADIDGTLEADAITIDGTAIGSLFATQGDATALAVALG